MMRGASVLLVMMLTISGCSHFRSSDAAAETEEQRAAQKLSLEEAEKDLAAGQNEAALAKFRQFLLEYPYSSFSMSARLGEAQALEGLGQWSAAAEIERDVASLMLKERPDIAALALYRLSFVYQELGEDSKAVAALLDAQRLGEHLPIQVRRAEVPARLAVFYAREGRDKEAMAYLADAEKGITKILTEPPEGLASNWLAKTYFQMGKTSINQLSKDSFSDFIRSERVVQIYLLKALKQNDPEWSSKALKSLKEMYRDLDSILHAEGLSREGQIQLGGELFDLIEGADLYRPLQGQKLTKYETDFYSYLTEVRKRTESLLYSMRGGTELTLESQRLNSLKRAGRVKVDTLLPEEKKSTISLPPKVVPSEDPNL